eukprot:scaffold43222_cov72-Phaeocystis_antarctica.AAC.3
MALQCMRPTAGAATGIAPQPGSERRSHTPGAGPGCPGRSTLSHTTACCCSRVREFGAGLPRPAAALRRHERTNAAVCFGVSASALSRELRWSCSLTGAAAPLFGFFGCDRGARRSRPEPCYVLARCTTGVKPRAVAVLDRQGEEVAPSARTAAVGRVRARGYRVRISYRSKQLSAAVAQADEATRPKEPLSPNRQSPSSPASVSPQKPRRARRSQAVALCVSASACAGWALSWSSASKGTSRARVAAVIPVDRAKRTLQRYLFKR